MRKRVKRSPEWSERFDEKPFGLRGDQTGEDEADFIRRALGLRKGHAVLDAPCGAGRVAVHLARRGILITGIDLTESHIRRARRRFRKEKLPGTFLLRDMREIDFTSEFDGVFNWQGSFGYFSDAQNLDVLRRFARALKPGGRVLIDQPNREHLLRHFRGRTARGGVTITVRWNQATQRVESTHRFLRDGRRRSAAMFIRLYTPAQFRRLFARAGLTVEALYGNLFGDEYNRGSRRLHIVGRLEKPG